MGRTVPNSYDAAIIRCGGQCPIDGRAFFKNQIGFRPRPGWMPEEASSAQPLQSLAVRVGRGKVGLNVTKALVQVT